MSALVALAQVHPVGPHAISDACVRARIECVLAAEYTQCINAAHF